MKIARETQGMMGELGASGDESQTSRLPEKRCKEGNDDKRDARVSVMNPNTAQIGTADSPARPGVPVISIGEWLNRGSCARMRLSTKISSRGSFCAPRCNNRDFLAISWNIWAICVRDEKPRGLTTFRDSATDLYFRRIPA